MARDNQPVTKKEFTDALTAALKAQTDDIVGTLTERSQAVENKLDAHEIATIAAFKRIDDKLNEGLTAALDYTALAKRVARIEKHIGIRS